MSFALTRRAVLLGAAIAAGLRLGLGASAAAAQDFPTGDLRLAYRIARDGDEIGSLVVQFRHQAEDRLIVTTDVRIQVRAIGFVVYEYNQKTVETWQAGKLIALTSSADDDGDQREVAFERQGDRLIGTYNGKARDLPGDALPSSLWHPDTIKRGEILETLKGRMRQVSVKDLGPTTLDLPIGQRAAHGYAFSGEFNRKVWYGEDGIILATEMIAKDDSIIRQELVARN